MKQRWTSIDLPLLAHILYFLHWAPSTRLSEYLNFPYDRLAFRNLSHFDVTHMKVCPTFPGIRDWKSWEVCMLSGQSLYRPAHTRIPLYPFSLQSFARAARCPSRNCKWPRTATSWPSRNVQQTPLNRLCISSRNGMRTETRSGGWSGPGTQIVGSTLSVFNLSCCVKFSMEQRNGHISYVEDISGWARLHRE